MEAVVHLCSLCDEEDCDCGTELVENCTGCSSCEDAKEEDEDDD